MVVPIMYGTKEHGSTDHVWWYQSYMMVLKNTVVPIMYGGTKERIFLENPQICAWEHL